MESFRFREFAIPDYMTGGLERYIEHGIDPGDFLTAVICNNLVEACAAADDTNLRNIPAYAAYLYNRAPRECWGSREKMQQWMQRCQGDEANGEVKIDN